jgi:hypothetical protein
MGGVIGAVWLPTQRLLITHSEILSRFLELKVNSVNANSREHAFSSPESISPRQFAWIIAAFPGMQLKDVRKWTKRKHTTHIFTPMMTPQEAAALDARTWLEFRRRQSHLNQVESESEDQAKQ